MYKRQGLVGSGWLHKLATDEKLRLPIIHHPAYSGGFVSPGVSGIADYLQLGFLPRLFGADMMVFVSYGGDVYKRQVINILYRGKFNT